MHKPIIICGPTACGKSYLANAIAQRRSSVIINADSMQIYMDLPILTAQPHDLKEKPEQYRLYSILKHPDHCSAGKWLLLANLAVAEAMKMGKTPIIVGGTGLYIKSLLYGLATIPSIDRALQLHVRDAFAKLGKEAFYQELSKKDPKIIGKIRPSDSQRMMRAMEVFDQTGKSIADFKSTTKPLYKSYLLIGLIPERKFLYDACNARFESMIKNGVIDEIKSMSHLLNDNSAVNSSLTHIKDVHDHVLAKAIGFKEISAYLNGTIPMNKAIEKAQQHTRNYAKRQLTWFKHQMSDALTISFDSESALITQARNIFPLL